MESTSTERRDELFDTARDIRKIELADYYRADEETFSAWKQGRKVDLEGWRNDLRQMTDAGRTWQRIKIVSEPLSDYQKMSLEIAVPEEDLRWLPRRLVSAVPLPGNDCFIFDSKIVAFNVLDGTGNRTEIQLTEDAQIVRFCVEAFSRAWGLAIPNGRYNP
ncbi:DUF6879 family protein [Actinomadura rubrisoli]|uniref:DUF6879 domain-containing protein n=1 Tax=Actinomadura rubrisoli TaxID=2530368 RepID=A0A4R5AFV2_9ACTN|nr:DUF6879 family protein [Actinomadura rubrisoli]TDD69784.1 hypothetical protein E1298_37155 [Actinomadura rubrisoli]